VTDMWTIFRSIFSRIRSTIRNFLPASAIKRHFRHVIRLAAAEDRLHPLPACVTQNSPTISFVVPVFNTKPKYLDDLLASFRMQTDGYCELILSDDGSSSPQTQRWLDRHTSEDNVTIVRGIDNKGIAAATNAGIARAKGRWVGLIDHDDALSPFAASRIMRALAAKPQCQFLYTDEVIADGGLRPVDYFLKPSWDPVLLSGINYINHLSLYRRDRLLQIGGLRDGFQGSQDYDLLLRYTSELKDNEIVHLPYPAYLWRRDGASYSTRFLETATDSARRALAERYKKNGQVATIDRAVSKDLHRVRFDVGRIDWPLVSVIVPNKDAFHLISRLLEDLTTATDYPTIEIIIVDNGSTDEAVLAVYDRYRRGPIAFRAEIRNEPFNFSRSINRGVAMSKGQYVLLLNNDIEVVESNWLKEMVSCFDFPETGIVGAKLLYPDRTIQHVGVIAGLGGLAGHWFVECDEDFPGPMGRLWTRQSLSVVTGACMLVSRICWDRVGHFDETVFAVAYNDVDFCLRAVKMGFRVIWTPFAKLIHHESASRGSDESSENIERFDRDKRSLRARHQTEVFEDPAFNPWYSKDRSNPVPVFLNKLPTQR
jgi:GT2 family glycosyltransferase